MRGRGVLLALMLALLILACGCGGSEKPDKTTAWIAAKDFVKSQLKAPATAEFPACYGDECVTEVGANRYRIDAYVDSENSFGALVRTPFYAVIRWTGPGRWDWTLETLYFKD